jgi:hypothetical protein
MTTFKNLTTNFIFGLMFDHIWKKGNELFPCVLQATYLNYDKLIHFAFELPSNVLTINKTPQ